MSNLFTNDDNIAVPENAIYPPGLDPMEEYQSIYLVEAVGVNSQEKYCLLPDVPLVAIAKYLNNFAESTSTSVGLAQSFIDSTIDGTHAAIRAVAETLRRDLIKAAKLYDTAGRKVTPEIAGFVKDAQNSARSSLSKIIINTKAYQILTENEVLLKFEGVATPWARNTRKKLLKPVVDLYSFDEWIKIFGTPSEVSKQQFRFKPSGQIISIPKTLSKALGGFNKILTAAEIAPELYNFYLAISDSDIDKALKSLLELSSKAGGIVSQEIISRVGYVMCLEAGVGLSLIASPVVSIPITIACGVGVMAAGIYIGSAIEDQIKTMTATQDITLTPR